MLDWLTRFFSKKAKLQVEVLDETGRLFRKKVKYENNTFTLKVGGEKQEYLVDFNKMKYDAKTNIPTLFYCVNDPIPLSFDHTRNPELDAIGFRKIMESKVIKDLFSDESDKTTMLLLILVCVNALLTIIVLAKQFGLIKGGG